MIAIVRVRVRYEYTGACEAHVWVAEVFDAASLGDAFEPAARFVGSNSFQDWEPDSSLTTVVKDALAWIAANHAADLRSVVIDRSTT